MSTTRPTHEEINQLAMNFSAIKPILDHYRHALALKQSPAVIGCADPVLLAQAVVSAKTLYDTAAAPVNAALRAHFGFELLDAVCITLTHSGYTRNLVVEDLRFKSGRYGMSLYGRVVRADGTVGVKTVKTEDLMIWHPDNEGISRIENLKKRPLESPL